jgi:hypothetical protein
LSRLGCHKVFLCHRSCFFSSTQILSSNESTKTVGRSLLSMTTLLGWWARLPQRIDIVSRRSCNRQWSGKAGGGVFRRGNDLLHPLHQEPSSVRERANTRQDSGVGDGLATVVPSTHRTCCDKGLTSSHGAEAAGRTHTVCDTQAVQRRSSTGSGLRVVRMDGRQRATAEGVQRIGGQAVIGCFQTVGTAVAEVVSRVDNWEHSAV